MYYMCVCVRVCVSVCVCVFTRASERASERERGKQVTILFPFFFTNLFCFLVRTICVVLTGDDRLMYVQTHTYILRSN